MSDSDDPDLESLRQAALSSLIKKKNTALQTNALFYRPTANSNLISIQPVQSPRDLESDEESRSGSEYVIEEGLSVSSGDVDEVIEEVIVSDEGSSEGEDAISIATNDSFDDILNSVEEELHGGKKRPANSDAPDGPVRSKKPRRLSEGTNKLPKDRDRGNRTNRDNPRPPGQSRRRSPRPIPDRIRNRSRSPERRRPLVNNDRRSPHNSGRRTNNRPPSRSPNNRRRRNKSPPNEHKRVISPTSVPTKRDRSRSPTENRNPRSRSKSPVVTIRKPISPPPKEQRRKGNTSRLNVKSGWSKDDENKGFGTEARSSPHRKSERPRSRSGDDRRGIRRRLSANNKDHKSRSPERRNKIRSSLDSERKSLSPRSKRLGISFGVRSSRSKSPETKKLSFGDHRLRAQQKKKDSSRRPTKRGSSGSRAGAKSNSPNGRDSRGQSKSPEVKPKLERVRKKSVSPSSPQNLTPDERERLAKRKLKFESKVSKLSGKVVLTNSTSRGSETTSESKERTNPDRVRLDPEPAPKSSEDKSKLRKSRLSSRLGKVVRDDEAFPRGSYHHSPDSTVGRETHESVTPELRKEAPTKAIGEEALPEMDKEDLRTKLQQKRAANVGRIFSVALQDTLVKEGTSPVRGNDRNRDRYVRNKKTSSRK